MKPKRITRTLIAGVIALGLTASIKSPSSAQLNTYNFKCQYSPRARVLTTYVITPAGYKPIIQWNSSYFADSSWMTIQTRCEAVASQLQYFARIGALEYLTTGIVNGQPAICVVGSLWTPCSKDTVLLTLKPGENPYEKLEQLFELRSYARYRPLWEIGNRGSYYVNAKELFESILVEDNRTTVEDSQTTTDQPIFDEPQQLYGDPTTDPPEPEELSQ